MKQDLSFRSEELAAQKTALIGRLIVLAAIVPLTFFLTDWPAPLFTIGIALCLACLGWGAWHVQQSSRDRWWYQYAFVTADCIVVTCATLYPNPFQLRELPPQFGLRFGPFIYFFFVLAALTYLYRPKLVLWGGISAAVCWSAGVVTILTLPDTIWREPKEPNLSTILELNSDPHFVDLGVRLQEIVVILLVAGLLALAVKRSRTIAVRQSHLASERSNLARYFPPKTADLLAGQQNPFSTPREHKCAVLFADLVGFTDWSERHSPRESIDLLREVHSMLADVVFKNDGTLDKFMGDGLMATFGTPEPSDKDASNALAAMLDMSDVFDLWKSNPNNALVEDLKLSIGAHYGAVVVGNIGSKNRLEFAVLGDTVNVASRLEAATRELDRQCVASAALVNAAGAGGDRLGRLSQVDLSNPKSISVKGRLEEIEVHCLR